MLGSAPQHGIHAGSFAVASSAVSLTPHHLVVHPLDSRPIILRPGMPPLVRYSLNTVDAVPGVEAVDLVAPDGCDADPLLVPVRPELEAHDPFLVCLPGKKKD